MENGGYFQLTDLCMRISPAAWLSEPPMQNTTLIILFYDHYCLLWYSLTFITEGGS